jgi:hypothetical protein
MPCDRIAPRATDGREKLLEQTEGARARDSDTALRHAVQSVRNTEDVRRKVDAIEARSKPARGDSQMWKTPATQRPTPTREPAGRSSSRADYGGTRENQSTTNPDAGASLTVPEATLVLDDDPHRTTMYSIIGSAAQLAGDGAECITEIQDERPPLQGWEELNGRLRTTRAGRHGDRAHPRSGHRDPHSSPS